ncbi:hypothetical protein K503DRAFT_770299 [Rhizopogon vinicolor AM-OR11-026]|uniref:Uncharacterized protein n=1 Tax=Rhizopogon vinicolor AM-OR11-026 TaxID=1314800 RepID=A0A1B7N171_9AGAM|nr:hypothetical protein K503DRAFT_770299 [Rhizopogon vinicolor AM-OR11-026]
MVREGRENNCDPEYQLMARDFVILNIGGTGFIYAFDGALEPEARNRGDYFIF